jgi:hypothetical protein
MKIKEIKLRLLQIEESADHPFSKILIKSLKNLLDNNPKIRTILKVMREKIDYEKKNTYSKDHKNIVRTLERLYKDIKRDYNDHQDLIKRVANL